MAEETDLLREMRDLLRLIAEPALAKRDERLRTSLLQVIGKSRRKAEAAVLMDGTRTQTIIREKCGIDAGDLSRLVKALRDAELFGIDDKQPQLVFPAPADLIESVAKG
jgi:hypothetical protein